MPQFILNEPDRGGLQRKPHPYYDFDEFTRGYVEAMFFTNGDTGDDREFILNELGVEALTHKACAAIKRDCASFQKAYAADLALACERDGYTMDRAGNDFWFTRQGHGVGFWDRGQLDAGGLGKRLTQAAKLEGECYPEVAGSRIHYR